MPSIVTRCDPEMPSEGASEGLVAREAAVDRDVEDRLVVEQETERSTLEPQSLGVRLRSFH